MCAYNASIPAASDRISVSQGDIQENFTQIKNLIDVNHVTFAGVAGEGKHFLVTFPNLAAPAAPAGNDINIFNATVGGNPELNIEKTGGSAIPFTQSASSGTSGWTYLPSGMKMVWGQDTIASGNSTKTTLFSSVASFPGFSGSALSIQLTRVHNATSQNFIQLESFTNLQFIARRSTSSTGAADIYAWFAVGA